MPATRVWSRGFNVGAHAPAPPIHIGTAVATASANTSSGLPPRAPALPLPAILRTGVVVSSSVSSSLPALLPPLPPTPLSDLAKIRMHAQARFAAAAAAAHKAIAAAPQRKASLSSSSAAASCTDDDDLSVESRPSAKRKRSAAELDAQSASSSASSSSSSFPSSPSSFASSPSSSVPCSSFPFLSDDEPSLAPPHSFHPVSKFLFALTDETRDRGSAKLCIVHVQLSHPAFAASADSDSSSRSASVSAASTARNFTTSFKIDGRKSFSNAPFKRYYSRAVHAAWFAQPTDAAAATLPLPNATFQTSTEGRVLFVLSQRNGRPHGKGFTGLKHDRTSFSSKHPLLCLSSNSVEYYLSVFVNLAPQAVDGEQSLAAPECWSEVDVDVSARFDAGEVTLDPVSLPSSAAASAPAARKQARTSIPHVSSLRTMAGSPFASSFASSSAASSTASSATASPVSPALAMSRCSSTDSGVSSASSAPSEASSSSSSSDSSDSCASEHTGTLASPVHDQSCGYDEGAMTPLHEQLMDDVEAAAEFDFCDEPQFAVDDDVLGTENETIAAQQQAHQGAWCLLPESSESECDESAEPLRNINVDCMPAFAFEQWAPECGAPLASPVLAPALSQHQQQQQPLLLEEEAAEPSPWKRARLEIALQSVADSLLPPHHTWASCSPVVHPHALLAPVCSPLPIADLQLSF